jgi:SAM-dependent methyltransferase
MNITKGWDWTKNRSSEWLIPCTESAYLAESWQSKGFTTFLDLGCGLGRHSVYMAKKGFNVSALDISEEGARHTREWAGKEQLAVDVKVGNMLALPYDDKSFDCIMAYNVIYHTNTAGFIEAVKEIDRVLKPGGELFITLISKGTWSYIKRDEYRCLDENTLLRNEGETEMDVPHFYVDIYDILRFFEDWDFLNPPLEYCRYDMVKPEYFSKHWIMLLRKRP